MADTVYDLSDKDRDMLAKWRHFRCIGDQQERYIIINRETAKVARLIMERCPSSDERSRALDKLEEARLWAQSAIMRNEARQ